jgi:hypothetical protein
MLLLSCGRINALDSNRVYFSGSTKSSGGAEAHNGLRADFVVTIAASLLIQLLLSAGPFECLSINFCCGCACPSLSDLFGSFWVCGCEGPRKPIENFSRYIGSSGGASFMPLSLNNSVKVFVVGKIASSESLLINLVCDIASDLACTSLSFCFCSFWVPWRERGTKLIEYPVCVANTS